MLSWRGRDWKKNLPKLSNGRKKQQKRVMPRASWLNVPIAMLSAMVSRSVYWASYILMVPEIFENARGTWTPNLFLTERTHMPAKKLNNNTNKWLIRYYVLPYPYIKHCLLFWFLFFSSLPTMHTQLFAPFLFSSSYIYWFFSCLWLFVVFASLDSNLIRSSLGNVSDPSIGMISRLVIDT